jgi:16S rRNA (guanine966-N2)-methyltransferase
MRIVAGEFRGRKLLSPRGGSIRPTADRVRESIFNIISSRILEARVLDLFAGTGALGLEALSRGAAQAVFVDQNMEAIRLIRSNTELCGAQERTQVIQGPVHRVLDELAGRSETFDLIFMDPPYGKGYMEKTLLLLSRVACPEAMVIAEHHAREPSPSAPSGWVQVQVRRYGDTTVSFFTNDPSLLQ